MIVRMRSCAQAAKVAEATGGVQLAGKPKPDGTPTFSRYVEIGVDFEAHRPVVESVSVLFELYDGDANSYAATGAGCPTAVGLDGHGGEIRGRVARRPAAGGFGAFTFRRPPQSFQLGPGPGEGRPRRQSR